MDIKRIGSQPSGKGSAGRCGLFPPGEKHWHGSDATIAVSHIAVQETLDGKIVDWMEHVTDMLYGG